MKNLILTSMLMSLLSAQVSSAAELATDFRYDDGNIVKVTGKVSSNFTLNSGLPLVQPSGQYAQNEISGFAVSDLKASYNGGAERPVLTRFESALGAAVYSEDAIADAICKSFDINSRNYNLQNFNMNASASESILQEKLQKMFPTSVRKTLTETEVSQLDMNDAVLELYSKQLPADLSYLKIYTNKKVSLQLKANELHFTEGSHISRVMTKDTIVCLKTK